MAEDESKKSEEKAKKWNPIKIVWEGIKCQCLWEGIKCIGKGINYIWKPIIKNHIAYLTLLVVIANGFLAYSSHRANTRAEKANSRAEKLFVGQNKPLIDVTPIGIVQTELKDEKKTKMCTTLFSIVNYSGFDAYNIAYDIKYQSDWISEWSKAEYNRKEKLGKNAEENREDKKVTLNHLYISRPILNIPKLMSGETKVRHYKWPPSNLDEFPPFASGEFDLELYVVGKKEGFPVLVRVTWENEDGYVFDEIHKYKLLCTKIGIGHAFTFIPEGIISQTHYGDPNSTGKNE